MGNLKCKIIGNQIWTVENLTKEQYYGITGRTIPVKNDNRKDAAKAFGRTSGKIEKKYTMQ